MPFGWYSLHLPTEGWPGWLDLGGWLFTEIDFLHSGGTACKRSEDVVQIGTENCPCIALTWTVHRMSKSSGYNTDSHNWLLPHSSQYLHHGTCVENAMKYNWWAMFAGDQTAVKITEVHNLLHWMASNINSCWLIACPQCDLSYWFFQLQV